MRIPKIKPDSLQYVLIPSLLIFLSLSFKTFAQSDNYYLNDAKTGAIDTLSYYTTQTILKQSAGILEREVDPEHYWLGPDDFLTISIVAVKSRVMELPIQPDGMIIIPEIGSIDLRNKTLAEARSLIRDKIGKIIRANEINVSLSKLRQFKVTVTGAVHKPSIVTSSAVDRVSEIIEKAGGLNKASIRKIMIIRENLAEPIKVDLLSFFMLHNKDANPYLLGGDQIIVPPLDANDKIEINGSVSSPGVYEFAEGDSLSTLIKFSQGFLTTAYLDSVEIVRLGSSDQSVNRWFVNLSSWKNISMHDGSFPGDFPMMMGDRIYVRRNPTLAKDRFVAIDGEVKLPGRYACAENEYKITDILAKAGGLTPNAYVHGAELIRRTAIRGDDPEMVRLGKLIPSEMTENEKKYFKARWLEQKGVMALDFSQIMLHPESEDNITVINGDSIYVPAKHEFINVQGRVVKPGLILYKKDYNYIDYVNEAGGYGYRADEGSTLVVKSRGEQFLAKDENYKLEPGDIILVPQQSELTFWDVFTTTLTVLTQIVTVAGVAIAIIRLK